MLTSGNVPLEKTINKQVYERRGSVIGEGVRRVATLTFPQAPSPTITSFLRISAIL